MKKAIRWIILAAAAVVFLVSCIQLFRIFFEYYKGKLEYAGIREYAVLPEKEENAEEEPEDDFLMPEIDFEALKEKNDDFCAWLVIPALEVNYPVVWCGDNDTYLTKTFEGGTNSAGCLFVDGANSPDLTDRNTLIYGHNMKNGAMFGTLSDFLQKEELAAEDPYFYLYTEDRAMRYQIIAYYTTAGDSSTYTFLNTDEEYDSYLAWIRRNDPFEGDEEAVLKERPRNVTLSTCYGRAGGTTRFVVHGALTEERPMEPKE